MVLRRPLRDLLSEDSPVWEVLSAAGGEQPRVEVLTPSIDDLTDSADRLSLVLPPPCEVRFVVGEESEQVWLQTAAGVDLSVARRLLALRGRGSPPLAVDFELLVDGRSVFRERVLTRPRGPEEDAAGATPAHVWHRVGGEEGLALEPGQEVVLRTSLPEGKPEGLGVVRAGFAGLVLEEHRRRPRTRASTKRPNLVWITVDTERADRTSAYGYSRETTPSLAALAERGLTFEEAYGTASWTWPSVASLFTGRLPAAHGVLDFRSGYLPDELPTLAESLQEAGWTTAGFSGNPLVGPTRGFGQGFETFEVTPACSKGESVVPPALEWLSRNRDYRFYLYVHLHDPHLPHTPRSEDLERFVGRERRFDPLLMQARTFELRNASAHTTDDRPRPELILKPGEGRWYSDVYDACVATGDYWVGVLLGQLDRWQLRDRTLVVYTADHGEELLDHRMLNHNHELWEELVHVPLVLAGPGIPQGKRVAGPISNRHLAATLARRFDVDFAAPADALDLLEPIPAGPVFFETRHGWWKGRQFVDIFGVREGEWKLIWCPEGRPWDASASEAPAQGEWRLYDLDQDPGEERNRSAEEKERVQRLRRLILESQASLATQRPRRKERAGAATRSLLEAAGYAGGEGDD